MRTKSGRWLLLIIAVLLLFFFGYKLISERVGKADITDNDPQLSLQEMVVDEQGSDDDKTQTAESVGNEFTAADEQKSDDAEAQNAGSDGIERTAVETMAEDFAQAYFTGNKETLSRYLVDPNGGIDTSPYNETSIVSFKGLDDLPYGTDEARGSIWVEFKIPEMDSYLYLTLMLVRVDGIWRVEAYGLEM